MLSFATQPDFYMGRLVGTGTIRRELGTVIEADHTEQHPKANMVIFRFWNANKLSKRSRVAKC
jgi:hypothetical protein